MVAITKSLRLETRVGDNQGFQNPVIKADLWDTGAFTGFDRMSSRDFVRYMTGDLTEEEKMLVGKYLMLLKDGNRMDEITYYSEVAGLLDDSRFRYGRDYFQNN